MALNIGSEIPINYNVQKYGVGVSWCHTGGDVDVDLQAVIVDKNGTIIDAVYYNNMKALKSVTHSGDELTGQKKGLDEVIWVHLNKLPDKVKLIIFVIAAFDRGHLRDVKDGKFHFLEETLENEVGGFSMERSEEEVDAIAMMIKDASDSWIMRVIESPAKDGRHFIDILEPTLGDLIRKEIPGAPKRQKVAFAMDKGEVADLPQTSSVKRIFAALGWDVSKTAGVDLDLDVSVVLFTKTGTTVGAVFFGNQQEFGIKHSGDNLTGEGHGDDETINVDLTQIPGEAEQLFFVVNIYTKGASFQHVSNPYCRICDAQGGELARYTLTDAGRQNGLLMARLFREPGDRWGFQALGETCAGNTWKDSVKDMLPILRKSPRELQHGASSPALGSGSAGSGGPGPECQLCALL